MWKEVAVNLKMREDSGYSGFPERGSRREATRATRRISCDEEGGGWNAGVQKGKGWGRGMQTDSEPQAVPGAVR